MFRGNVMTTTTGIVCIKHFFFTMAEASVEAEEKALSLLISTSVGKACLTIREGNVAELNREATS